MTEYDPKKIENQNFRLGLADEATDRDKVLIEMSKIAPNGKTVIPCVDGKISFTWISKGGTDNYTEMTADCYGRDLALEIENPTLIERIKQALGLRQYKNVYIIRANTIGAKIVSPVLLNILGEEIDATCITYIMFGKPTGDITVVDEDEGTVECKIDDVKIDTLRILLGLSTDEHTFTKKNKSTSYVTYGDFQDYLNELLTDYETKVPFDATFTEIHENGETYFSWRSVAIKNLESNPIMKKLGAEHSFVVYRFAETEYEKIMKALDGLKRDAELAKGENDFINVMTKRQTGSNQFREFKTEKDKEKDKEEK